MHHDEELHDHGDFARGKKSEGDWTWKAIAPFLKEKAIII
jgi:hypothetical protein